MRESLVYMKHILRHLYIKTDPIYASKKSRNWPKSNTKQRETHAPHTKTDMRYRPPVDSKQLMNFNLASSSHGQA
jgi:hypothetical protein